MAAGWSRSGAERSGVRLMQQILSLKLMPWVGKGTLCPNSTSSAPSQRCDM
ncbi:hypothetical protein STEG23_007330, partial [Scotinomys teguina]